MGQAASCCWLFSRGWMAWDQRMNCLEVSAHECQGAASPLTFAKPLTYGGLALIGISLKVELLPIDALWQRHCNTSG